MEEERIKARYFFISLIVHALLFLQLSMSGGSGSSGGSPGKNPGVSGGESSDNPHVIPKATEVEIQDAPPPEKTEIVEKKVETKPIPKALHNCEGDHWYGGIGVQEDFFTGGLEDIYKGYPADRAGLQKGDKIILVNGVPETIQAVRGTPGSVVTITVQRGSSQLLFTMTREKICTIEAEGQGAVPEPLGP